MDRHGELGVNWDELKVIFFERGYNRSGGS